MASQRPIVLILGSPNELRELVDGDSAILQRLADANGFEFLLVDTTASAVNGLGITPTAAGSSPAIYARGAGTDLDVLLRPKGAGKVKAGAAGSELEVVTLTASQVLTLKDLTDATNLFAFSAARGSVRQYVANPATTAHVNAGFPADLTQVGTAASGDQSARPMISFATAATTDTQAGVRTALNNYVRGLWSPRLVLPIRTPASVANVRIWAGFMDADLDAVDSPTTQKVVAVRFSTAVPDTNLQFVTCSGAAVTVTDTGVACTASTDYEIDIERRAGDYRLLINGTVRATVSTTLPANSSFMGVQAIARTLENVAKTLYVGSVRLWMK